MEKIIKYFTEEKKLPKPVASVLAKTLTKYEDIHSEFLYWLDYRNFSAPQALCINGYTAEDIHNIEPSLDGSGVYNFMVTLRDNPEKAENYIKNGFTRK